MTKRAKEFKTENFRTAIYIITLVIGIILWLLLNEFVTVPEPAGRFAGTEQVVLWKYQTSFDNKDMEYINSASQTICDSIGENKCSELCAGEQESDCSLENIYYSSFLAPVTEEIVLRTYVTLKGNTVCKCF